MKLNAPRVPPTPPAASCFTTYPLGASHRGYDTLHWTGALLLKQGSPHHGKGGGFGPFDGDPAWGTGTRARGGERIRGEKGLEGKTGNKRLLGEEGGPL